MKLNLKSVDLNLLTVFEAIMETGQLSRAGEQLGMSQPAMSAALTRLRLTLNDELFLRYSAGLSPTPRAREIYNTVQASLDLIRNELQSGKQFVPKQCHRHFSVMGGDYMEILFYGPLLNRVNAAAPDITSEVKPVEVMEATQLLKQGEVDMAIHYVKPGDHSLEFKHILGDQLVVVTRRNHPRIRRNLTVRIYYQEKHVTLMPVTDNTSHLELFVSGQTVERKVGAKVNQFSGMIPVILNTDYFCTMPKRLAEWFAMHYPLAMYPLPLSAPELPMYLIWANRFNNDLAHAWFREQLSAVMLNRP